jgi:ribosomal protein S18 acetylase RimI-like enzyme
MTAGLVLRLAGPEDAGLVMVADVFDHPAEAGYLRRFLGDAAAPERRLFMILAEFRGRIVGFASGAILDHPDKPPGLFIMEVGVNAAVQRQGIGRALVQAIRAEGRRRGCAASWVATEGDNDPARSLYRSFGGPETEAIVMYEWDETAADTVAPLQPPPARG